MSVTASRLGSAPITFDWSSLVAVPAGAGAGSRSQGMDAPSVQEAWDQLKSQFNDGKVGFYLAATNNDLSQAAESQALAMEILKRGQFTDCLFLGIGGSSLGPLSLLGALADRCESGIRFHFMENPDPTEWKSTIKGLQPERTLVCAVTKSGTTFETISQLLLAVEWIGRTRIKNQMVAITDPAKGDLKAFATQEGIPTLHIHPSIGGRFSIFSPVGLFAAALAGLDTQGFMQGAKQVHDYVERTPIEKNPLFILAYELIRHAPKRPIHVCMPYSTRLKQIGAWFVQLWGESLGKDGKGFTPLAAVGATDQHSILQLLRDGPDDKVTFFLTVDKVADEVKIPSFPFPKEQMRFPSFKLLEGHTLHELLAIEYRATSLVLTKRNRPNISIRLDELNERSLGALYYAFSVMTAITGSLWKVNPFDQPGVEEGKVYIREALSGGPAPENPEDDDNSPVGRLRRDRT